MELTRRKTLAILGGGVVLAAGAGAYRVTRTPDAAVAPWQMAGEYDDFRMRVLSYAILAPNPHNRQPWMVDLSVADQITLFVDTDRMLPATDPFNRQITIGLGCFLELLRMAAAQEGVNATFDLFPEGEDAAALDGRPVAVVKMHGAASADPLFEHVMARRSQKVPYDVERPVSDQVLATLKDASLYGSQIQASNDASDVAHYRERTTDALLVEIETPHTFQESIDVFRIGKNEINANPDGIDFSGPLFETLHLTGQFTREATGDPSTMAYKAGVDAVLANTQTAMAHIWLISAANSRIDQINIGRDWLRLNLSTTSLGVAMQPLSQILQEYPEMQEHYGFIHETLAPEGGTVQMFARLGYCAPVTPSPRWPVEEKILHG